MGDMDDILIEFQKESKELVDILVGLLDEIEGDVTQAKRLEDFAQQIDRIMGGANTLLMVEENKLVRQIGKFAELGKALGYKAPYVADKENLYNVLVAFLMDAVDSMQEMLDRLGEGESETKQEDVNEAFIDRLKWLAEQFDKVKVAIQPEEADNAQGDIDAILAQLMNN